MPPAFVNIDIIREAGDWPEIEERIVAALEKTFPHLDFKGDGEVSVVLADDAFVQNLNKEYREKDKPTNVLSFPQIEPGEDVKGALGDIILAIETITAEAARDHKTFEHHVMHLCVHGMLHLIGFDHEDEEDAEEMERLETRILASVNIKNPYDV